MFLPKKFLSCMRAQQSNLAPLCNSESLAEFASQLLTGVSKRASAGLTLR